MLEEILKEKIEEEVNEKTREELIEELIGAGKTEEELEGKTDEELKDMLEEILKEKVEEEVNEKTREELIEELIQEEINKRLEEELARQEEEKEQIKEIIKEQIEKEVREELIGKTEEEIQEEINKRLEKEIVFIKEVTYYEGIKVGDIELATSWKWKEPKAQLKAKIYACEIIYVSQNPNYESVEAMAVVKVAKANPRYEVPKGIKGETENTLQSIQDQLPEEFELMDSLDTKLEKVGYYEYKIKYTPRDTENYNIIENIPIIIQVVKKEVPITDITIISELKMAVGGKEKLEANIIPEGATNREINWVSSNEEIVTVDQEGNVEAKKIGEAIITASTTDGRHTAECKITVIEMEYEVEQEGEEISIRQINPGTSKKVFEEKLPTRYEIVIKDHNGIAIGEDGIIGTGYTMELYYKGQKKAEAIKLVVKGDVTGDGKAENVDMIGIIYDIIGKQELKGVYAKAGDINGDNEIDGRDLTAIIYHIINKKGFEWD